MAARNELEILLRAKADTDAAFGQAIKGIRSIETETKDATKKASGFMKGLEDSITNMGGSWVKAGIGVAAGAKAFELVTTGAVDAAKAIAALAGKAEAWSNVAAATGLGVVQVQKLQSFMEDAGFEAGDLESAMRKLQTEIASGGAAMAAFGIDVRKFKDMQPEEQLRAMAAAIMAIENPTARAAAAVAAFGKGGAKQLAALAGIAEGLDKTMEAFSAAEVKHLAEIDTALDKAARAWEDWKKRATYSILKVGEAIFNAAAMRSQAGPSRYAGYGDYLSSTSSPAAPPVAIMTPAERKAAAEKAAAAQATIDKLIYDSRLRARKEFLDRELADVDRHNKELLAKQLEEYRAETDASKDRYQRRIEYERAFYEIAKRLQQEQHDANIRATEDFGRLGDAIAAAGDAFGSGFLSNFGRAIGLFSQISVQAQNATTNMQKATVAIGATASAFQSKSVMQGAGAGAAAGSMFGPWGAAIGAIAGGILGALGKAKSLREELAKMNQSRDAFLKAAGGVDVLREKLGEASYALNALLDVKKPQDFQKAMEELQRVLDLQNEAAQALDDAMQRYGITIEQLGPKFAQQKLDEQFAQIFKDWEVLSAAGADHLLLLAQMGPAINEYVQRALAAGATIPDAMRPILQQMIDQGLLLDENGKAYTSIEEAGIHFAQTVTDAIAGLIKKITDLVNALLGIQPAIDGIHTPGSGNPPPPNTNPGAPGREGNPDYAHGGVVLPFVRRFASGGVVRPPGMVVPGIGQVGEGGEAEVVSPVKALFREVGKAAAQAAREASGGGVQHIHVHVDGRELMDVVNDRKRRGF